MSLVQLAHAPCGELHEDKCDEGHRDAVGNVERIRGKGDAEERGNVLGNIRIVEIPHPRHHTDADVDEDGRSRSRGDHQRERRHRESEQEGDRRRTRRQSCAPACLNACTGLEIGDEHRNREEGAHRRGDGVDMKDLVEPRQIAVLVEETRLAADADRRAEAREEIRQEEREEERQVLQIKRTRKIEIEEDRRDAVRHAEDALGDLRNAHRDADDRPRENADECGAAYLARREHEENDEGDRREDHDGLREVTERERDLFRIDREQLCIAHADHGEEDADARTDRDLDAARYRHDNELTNAKHCNEDEQHTAQKDNRARNADRHILELHHRDREDRDAAHAGREGKRAVRIEPHRHRRSEDHEHHAREHRPRRDSCLPHHMRHNGEHIAHRRERRETRQNLRADGGVMLLQPELPFKE